jgi:biotin carboxyl carrier protein
MKIKIGEKVYEVEIFDSEGEVKIIVNGKEFVFGKEKEKEISIPQISLPKRDFSKKEILAPIDGIISEIFIKEGDFVKKNQKLLFLSSMKMENEIVSDLEGKIKEVLVKKGQKVKKDEVLIKLI